jgi:hypothetical protein
VITGLVLECHRHLFFRFRSSSDTGAEADVQTLLLELTLSILCHLLIHGDQEIVYGFEYDNFRAEPSPYTPEFQPDNAGPNDSQTFRHLPKFQSSGGIDDEYVVPWRRANVDGNRTRGDDYVVRGYHVCIAIGGGNFNFPIPD